MGMTGIAVRKGGRGRRGVPRYRAMAEINMTPFIDIVLVLLNIFFGGCPAARDGRCDRFAEDQSGGA